VSTSDAEPVGSLAEEAARLLHALGGGETGDEPARCPHGWCPLCRVLEHVQDNPEILEQATQAAADAVRAVRVLLDQLAPKEER
jgi:heme oxygenase